VSKSSISVIIPAHNAEHFLAEAVASVISQDYAPLEVIVVDDGSTDATAAVARNLPVTYLAQAQAGAAAARNHGVQVARGELIAFLDADDLWCPGKLSRQIRAISADAELEMVFGHVQQFVCPSLTGQETIKPYCPPAPIPGYHPGTMLIYRASFLRVGYFDTRWQAGEFMDWYAKAVSQELKFELLPEVLMRRRLHASNQGAGRQTVYKADYLRILRESVHRRRALDQAAD